MLTTFKLSCFVNDPTHFMTKVVEPPWTTHQFAHSKQTSMSILTVMHGFLRLVEVGLDCTCTVPLCVTTGMNHDACRAACIKAFHAASASSSFLACLLAQTIMLVSGLDDSPNPRMSTAPDMAMYLHCQALYFTQNFHICVGGFTMNIAYSRSCVTCVLKVASTVT